MVFSLLSLVIIIYLASKLDKWQTTKHINGKLTLDDIDVLFHKTDSRR